MYSLLAYSSLVKNGDGNEGDENKVTDVHALLAQKEKDLILAAELGKALLEKNEDLSQHNEKMAEDFSKQLEVRAAFLLDTVYISIRTVSSYCLFSTLLNKIWVVWA